MRNSTRLEKVEFTAAVREQMLLDSICLRLSAAEIARRTIVPGPPPRAIRASNIGSYWHSDPARRALPSADVCDALDGVLRKEPGTFRRLAGHPPKPNLPQIDIDEDGTQTHIQRFEATLLRLPDRRVRDMAADLAITVVERIATRHN